MSREPRVTKYRMVLLKVATISLIGIIAFFLLRPVSSAFLTNVQDVSEITHNEWFWWLGVATTFIIWPLGPLMIVSIVLGAMQRREAKPLRKDSQPLQLKDVYQKRALGSMIMLGISFVIMLMFEAVTLLSDPGPGKWLAYSFLTVFAGLGGLAAILVVRYTLLLYKIGKQEKEREEEQQETSV